MGRGVFICRPFAGIGARSPDRLADGLPESGADASGGAVDGGGVRFRRDGLPESGGAAHGRHGRTVARFRWWRTACRNRRGVRFRRRVRWWRTDRRRTVERRTLPAARRRVVFGGIFGTRRTEKSGKTRASRKAAHGRRGIREKTETARFHWRLFAKSLILQGETRNNARAR